MGVFWEDEPPPQESLARDKVFSIPPGPEVFVRLIGSIQCVRTHWTGSRTLPCMMEKCKFCPDPKARTYGYVDADLWERDAVANAGTWVQIVLTLTETVTRIIMDRWPQREYVGMRMCLRREKQAKNSQLLIRPNEKQPTEPPRAARDIVSILERMWDIKRRAAATETDDHRGFILPL